MDTPSTSPMTSGELLQRLDDLGVAYSLHHHPAVFSVEDGADYFASISGVHCKNLFLRDSKKKYWLVVAPIDRQIQLKDLSKKIGASRLSFAQPPRLMEHLGVEPGSVTPFALINDRKLNVSVILDDWLMRQPLINIHPLVNTATVGIAPKDLLRFIHLCGHSPCLVDLETHDENGHDVSGGAANNETR